MEAEVLTRCVGVVAGCVRGIADLLWIEVTQFQIA